jgi:cytochrome c-type biogenesis protein
MRNVTPGSTLILAGLLLAGCGDGIPSRIAVGEPAPDYGALTLAGDSARLEQHRGKVVLLNVWATWCLPCREEIPALQELYERTAARGFDIVGVSIDGPTEAAAVRRFADDYGISYTLWHDGQDLISTRYRLIGVPATFLIDREGILRWLHLGPIKVDNPEMNQAIETALADG